MSHRNDISRNAIGALSELRAAADLIDKGWEVFRAVASDNSCDLIIVRGSVMRKIEVRTGSYNAKGIPTHPARAKDVGRYDHYAVVLSDQILYVPPLPLFLKEMVQ